MTVTTMQSYPLAARNTPWDNNTAIERLKLKAGGPDKDTINWEQYGRFFMWHKENPSKFADFKLPYVDVIGGKLHIVPKAVFAITGGRGVDSTTGIKKAEKDEIKLNVCKYYKRMAKQFDDNQIICPFEMKQEVTLKGRVNKVLQRLGLTGKFNSKEVGEKWHNNKMRFMDAVQNMAPNITSFDELEQHNDLKEYIMDVEDLTWAFVTMMENILFGIKFGSEPVLIDGNNFAITIDHLEEKVKKLIKDFESRFVELSPFESDIVDGIDDFNVGLDNDEDIGSTSNPQVLNTIRSNMKGMFKSPEYLYDDENVSVFKSDGQAYLYGKMTNAYKDSEEEVLTATAHKKYVAFLDKYPKLAPTLWTWHTLGTARKNKAIWWDYSDNFLHLVWPLEKDELGGIQEFCKNYTPAMSHGFYILDTDPEKSWKITNYVTFEGTLLPLEFASNKFTRFITMNKNSQQKGFSPARREVLVLMHGEEFVKALEAETNNITKSLEDAGLTAYKDEQQDNTNDEAKEMDTNKQILEDEVIDDETKEVVNSDEMPDFNAFSATVISTLEQIMNNLNATKELATNNAKAIEELSIDRQQQKKKGSSRQSALDLFTSKIMSVVGNEDFEADKTLSNKKPEETDPQETEKNGMFSYLVPFDN